MSIRIMQRVWDTPCRTHTEKLVVLALADNASDEGYCYPSISTIAKKCDLCEAAVKKNIRTLAKAGWLTVNSRVGTSNSYSIHPPNAVTPPTPLPPPNAEGGESPNAVTPHPPNAVTPNHQGTIKEPSEDAAPPAGWCCDKFHKPHGQPKQANPMLKQFVDGWTLLHNQHCGSTGPYIPTPNDNKMLRWLASNFNATDATAMLADADLAMQARGPKYWHCFKAVSIAYFLSHLNEVRAELRKAEPAKLPKRTTGGPADF